MDSLPAEPQGGPRILEWVAYPFSSGSSRPRNRTGGLLHCRQILYQLSYQGSPLVFHLNKKLEKKRDEALTQATSWTNLENILLSEEAICRGLHTPHCRIPCLGDVQNRQVPGDRKQTGGRRGVGQGRMETASWVRGLLFRATEMLWNHIKVMLFSC